MNKDSNLAVLIDGDNIPSRYIKEMMEEIAKYGTPSIKRIYGDWTKPHLSKWKTLLLENAIQPIQQYGYTQGKNATDSAMIIDAMDILYGGKTDGFCIVSSDSDFTRLATRLRESSQFVIGIGEEKTPEPFIVACDKFIYLEILKSDETDEKKGKTKTKTKKTVQKVTPKITRLIRQSIYDCADDDGWAFLGDVGSLINKKQPNFDPRNFGFYKLTPLMDAIGTVKIEERQAPNSRSKHIYVKNISSKKKQ
ncbi:NYN domain-containing protein [Brumimicrobium aurantiacum]|uniref:NYN domain-containing protein n=1 Tax=Brumimicrobium aurantiacum TaxID=1737063 RepID=A0A3E1F071_9FLAO|nr:NYN domain-containing protein [Brumimicrobium aurantiacum]RFC55123.1 NYN domain-containing protein [Brumimicrobium aurantiacum]